MKQARNAIKKFFITLFWAIEKSRTEQARREVEKYITDNARTLEDIERLHKRLEAVGK
jgi:hypothetical protein